MALEIAAMAQITGFIADNGERQDSGVSILRQHGRGNSRKADLLAVSHVAALVEQDGVASAAHSKHRVPGWPGVDFHCPGPAGAMIGAVAKGQPDPGAWVRGVGKQEPAAHSKAGHGRVAYRCGQRRVHCSFRPAAPAVS